MMSSGTVASSVIFSRRVPSTLASASSSRSAVRLGVADAIALLDGGVADRLREVALAGAGRPEEERVLALGDEAPGGELEDEGAVASSC